MANKKKNIKKKKSTTKKRKTTNSKKKTTVQKSKVSNNTNKTSKNKSNKNNEIKNKKTDKVIKEKSNRRELIFNIIIAVLVIVVIISFYFLIQKRKEEEITIKEIDESKLVKPDNNSTDIDIPKKTVKEEIAELKTKYNNNDVIGILNIDNEIYTPVVQTKDNQYYLKYSLSKKRSVIGSTFMDYRLNKDSKQINIYGHNHSNKKYNPPFKTLENYLKKAYFEEHRYIEFKVDNEIQKYEIFSIVIGEKVGTEEHMNIKYTKNSDWLKHFNRLKNRSIFKTDTKLTENDKIIVLQTCLFGKYKGKLMLVIGKRVDNE